MTITDFVGWTLAAWLIIALIIWTIVMVKMGYDRFFKK